MILSCGTHRPDQTLRFYGGRFFFLLTAFAGELIANLNGIEYFHDPFRGPT